METLFKRYEHDNRFRHIFVFKDQLGKLGRELRVAQRPLVEAVCTTTSLSRHVREGGKTVGYSFPEVPGKVKLAGPSPINDYLTPSMLAILPLLEIKDTLEGGEVDKGTGLVTLQVI